MRRLPIVVFVLLAGGCRATSRPPATVPEPGRLPDSTHWVRNSAEYRAAAEQAYRLARERVVQAARGREPGTWAVILDADETVLDNSQYQKELARDSAAFTPESWNAWCRRREAGAVPGSQAFLTGVRELGGRIAIVTNRVESVCADTEAVFDRLGLAYDVILCKPDRGPGEKQTRFDRVADGSAGAGLPPLDVVLWVGDNILDFPGVSQQARDGGAAAFAPFGVRYVIVPNPMYGSWERNPRD